MTRGRPQLQMQEQESDYLPFTGGLDLVTPQLQMPPGRLRQSQNLEVGINGRYKTLVGYERFDGRPKPSEQTYWQMDVTITGSIVVGDVVDGVTSGAQGTVIAVVTTETPNYIVMTKVTGTFQNPEDLNVSAVKEGETLSLAIVDGADTNDLHAQYKNLAADEYRADIAAVPGSGNILGVVMLNNIIYAFRNNAGATATDLYKSSGTGWTQVTLGRELSFTSGGPYEVKEGDTITGATSAATADVDRVVLTSGSWATSDAAGKFILSNQMGTFQSELLDVGANMDVATITGDSTQIALNPGGRYEFDIHNFGGQLGTKRIYGCDGANPGFEFDGTTYVPIDTGVTDDKPTHVIAHKNHLFFSFGSSAQHSGVGTPYIWTPLFGAGELAVGDDIEGFVSEPGAQGGAALGIYSRNSVHILYGTGSSDWDLVRYRDELGAYAYTLQQFGTTFFLDDRGVTNLQTTQAFGNFAHATISWLIQPWINARKTSVVASCIMRDKSQYRLFFSGKEALYTTIVGGEVLGLMPVLLEHELTCCFSLEDTSGNEVVMFGADNGFVYQMEKGTSFDGVSIDLSFTTHFHYSKTPRMIKRYNGCLFDLQSEGFGKFDFTYEIGYGSPEFAAPPIIQDFTPVRWDEFTWDEFTWDGSALLPATAKLDGSAENISLIVRSNQDYYSVLEFAGAVINLKPRRIRR